MLVVDGMNVIGSRPDGWWKDRPAAARRLWSRLASMAAVDAGTVVLVLDGAPITDLAEGMHEGVAVRYARRQGPNAADDRIVELVARADLGCRVVTSDRVLRDRVLALGAEVVGSRTLLARLDALDSA